MESSETIVKRIILALIVLVLGAFIFPGLREAEAGQKILVVQSIMIPLYEQVFEGFTSVCGSEDIQRLAVYEKKSSEVLRKVHEARPALILAIGLEALQKIKEINQIPVVYCMVLTAPTNPLLNGNNITGVSMNVPQGQQLKTFVDALPDVQRIGLLYDPAQTGRLVGKASAAARKMGISVISREVQSPREVAPAMEGMKGAIDAFWMLPDLTVINEVTIEYMLSFSMENRIPLLTFSDMYVEKGALMSISVDRFDIGVQAGELARRILSGTAVKDIRPPDARKGIRSLNLNVAKKLGIHLEENIIKESVVIR